VYYIILSNHHNNSETVEVSTIPVQFFFSFHVNLVIKLQKVYFIQFW